MSYQPIQNLSLNDITVVVINYRTLDLTERCVTSLRKFYPEICLLLVDNGSGDESTCYIQVQGETCPNTQVILNPKNIHHGPALHLAFLASTTRLVFTLDSDCQVLRSGFLEQMLDFFQDPLAYATGRLAQMNRFGYEIARYRVGSIAYIHPSAMLIDRLKYMRLKPFSHHGSPCLQNMRSAAQAGWRLHHYRLESFIYHQGRGTCSRYGYGLGWRHVVEYLLNRMESKA